MASGTTHDDDRVEGGSGAEGSGVAEQRSLEASGTPVPRRKKGHKAKHGGGPEVQIYPNLDGPSECVDSASHRVFTHQRREEPPLRKCGDEEERRPVPKMEAEAGEAGLGRVRAACNSGLGWSHIKGTCMGIRDSVPRSRPALATAMLQTMQSMRP